MSEIARRTWREPAVFLGLITTIALVVITLATGDKWDTATIAGVAAPLVSALGIRQLVSPTTGDHVVAELNAKSPPEPPT